MSLRATLLLCAIAVLGTVMLLAVLGLSECWADYRRWRRKRKGEHDDDEDEGRGGGV